MSSAKWQPFCLSLNVLKWLTGEFEDIIGKVADVLQRFSETDQIPDQ